MEPWLVKVCTVGQPDETGYVFTLGQLTSIVNNAKESIKNRNLMGELGCPTSVGGVYFSKVSHLVVDLFLDNNDLIAQIEVIDTPCGRILRKLKDTKTSLVFVMNVCLTGNNFKINQIYVEAGND